MKMTIDRFNQLVAKYREEHPDPEDKFVLGVDFDNTLFETDYPEIIRPIYPIINFVKEASKNKDVYVILWTCRTSHNLRHAIEACTSEGVMFDYVNRQKPYNDLHFESTRKLFCQMLIDDTSYNFDVEDFVV